VVIDANWRWLHKVSGAENCYTGNQWDASACPDDETCAKNCAIDGAGAEYAATYGIHTSGSELSITFLTKGQYGTNIGARVYLLDTEDKYQMFDLRNKEFTFDVDDSQLVCGLNGALYMVEMKADGGMGIGQNKAGAKYGTGYCDAQCPHDMKFIEGLANVEGWKPSPDDPNTGSGKYGTCCTEMDIWEANSISTAYTPHACTTDGPFKCQGAECGDNGPDRFKGVCDKNGCDFQTYRLNETNFYGPGSGFKVDTTKPVTVITQFITTDGTDTGVIKEIRRVFRQNGQTIELPKVTIGGQQYNSVSNEFCKAALGLFQDGTTFLDKGGFTQMSKSMSNGMVLAMSLWADDYAHMLWLDSTYPTDQPPSKPGVGRGSCATDSGKPTDIQRDHPSATVKFSNVKWGPIGSTTA